MASANLPFVLHLTIETAAAASFILQPEKQLPNCSAAARLILRQYGGLLLSTNLICLIIIFSYQHQPPSCSCDDSWKRLLAAALGTYHAWPTYRAFARLRWKIQGDGGGGADAVLGGPFLHLVTHLLCVAAFLLTVIFWDG